MSDEEQEYVTLDEAAQALGTKKGSLYYYLRALAIEPRKFPLNKHAFISKTDVERIRVAKNSPWKIAQPTHQISRDSVPDKHGEGDKKSSSNRSDLNEK